ncbi:general substrate transporter [Gonapodya prolifera JEL478]|uniref:General substrate transporter n=1 Tax=Gonapodya prolifera (strain JEL478) TaxID=1344416 RepID=A0A139AYE6_GONPJ|nr:general substrate transporter [Gonapodya prolifera JEL478]|eukprot:KXS21772.1 general substrate transporter [Gonapodya prolifera JEL478]
MGIFGKHGYASGVAITCAVGGFLFGYEQGIMNQVLNMDSYQIYFTLATYRSDGSLAATPNSDDTTGWLTSIFLVGCIPGAFSVSYASEHLGGRKNAIYLASAFFLAGAIIQAAANGLGMFYAGRFVGGMGVGCLTGAVPLYIAECAPTVVRGRIGTLWQLLIVTGILVSNIVNAILISVMDVSKDTIWRVAFGVQIVPVLFLFGALSFLPETPRFLLSKGKEDQARAVLARLNGEDVNSAWVDNEFKVLKDSIDIEKHIPKASWIEMWTLPLRPRSIASFGLLFFQQVSGVNAINYYSSSLFIGMGISKDLSTKLITVLQSVLFVVFTGPAIYSIDKVGRRFLLYVGGAGMCIACWSLVLWIGLFNGTQLTNEFGELVPDPTSAKGKAFGALGVLCIYFFIISFAFSWGPVAWVYIGETFPLRARGKGASIGATSNWIFNFIVIKCWPYATRLGNWQYAILGCTTLLSHAFVYYCVPETKGKSLEEMDEVFGYAATTDEERRIMTEMKNTGDTAATANALRH